MEFEKCPCCGGEAQMQTRLHNGGEFWIECKVCGMRTKYVRCQGIGESEKLAKKLWERKSSMNKWINVKEAVPDTDREALVIVNGMAGKKVKFVNAIMIGLFDKAEGWILEDWPECESIEVSYWMEMPELPDELKRSNGGVYDDRGL